jgi:hypothetical protein
MSNKIIPSLINLPVELIYRILDNLEPFDILVSVRDVCTRLNTITETYHRYKVKGVVRNRCIFPHAGNAIKWKYLMSIELLWCRFLWIVSLLWTKSLEISKFWAPTLPMKIDDLFSDIRYKCFKWKPVSRNLFIQNFRSFGLVCEKWWKIYFWNYVGCPSIFSNIRISVKVKPKDLKFLP